MSLRLAKLTDVLLQLLSSWWRWHIFIQYFKRGDVTIAQVIHPVFYLVAAAIAAMDMEIERIVADAERPISRHSIVSCYGASYNQQQHYQRDQFMAADKVKYII